MASRFNGINTVAPGFNTLATEFETPLPNNEQNSNPINVTSPRGHVVKNSDFVKAHWDNKSTEIFIRLCVQEMNAGNRPGTHFNKIGWDNLIKKFSAATNRKYTRIQLKNKWDSMKKEWGLWQALLHGESGLGWNHIKGTVDATPEWWQKKIQVTLIFGNADNNKINMFSMTFK